MKGGAKLVSLIFLVGLVLAAGLTLRDLDPAYRAARASQQQAKAAAEWARTQREQARAAAEARQAPARAELVTYGLAVAVGVAGGAGLGLVVWLVVNATSKARRIEPTASGQFPLVRVSGPGWQGWLDPNRAPGNVTLIGDKAPAVRQPLALSEAGHVQLAQYAGGVAAIAAATRHEGTAARAAIDAAAPMIQPQPLSMPLPAVTEADPAHIDRLLALQGPADEVQEP